MKKSKRVLSMLLVMVMIMAMVPVGTAFGANQANLAFAVPEGYSIKESLEDAENHPSPGMWTTQEVDGVLVPFPQVLDVEGNPVSVIWIKTSTGEEVDPTTEFTVGGTTTGYIAKVEAEEIGRAHV